MFTSNDKLFIPQTGINLEYSSINRFNGLNNDHSIFLIVEGYKNASFELLDTLLNDSLLDWLKLDSQIYPLLFLFRHYLEMIIKDTIRYENLISRKINSDDVGFPPEHSLLKLWTELKQYLEKRYANYSDDLKVKSEQNISFVENLLTELDNLDEGSYAFRYPFDKPKKSNKKIKYSLTPMTINLQNLRNSMEKLSYFFDGINEQARIGLDELQTNKK